MAAEELTFSDYIRVGMIYSDLSEEEVLAKADKTEREIITIQLWTWG